MALNISFDIHVVLVDLGFARINLETSADNYALRWSQTYKIMDVLVFCKNT